MNSKLKSWGLLILGIILVFSLTACGNDDSGSAGKDGKVTLTLWQVWSDDTSENAVYKKRLDEFNKSHDDIEIKLENTANDQYRTKLKTRAAGKQLPDIFNVWPGAELEPLVKAKVVQPLPDSVTADTKKLIPESTLQPLTFDGKQYGIPAVVSYTSIIYYDKDVVAKAGYDKFPTTWSDFQDLIKKLNAQGVTPIELGDKAQWPLQSCFMSTLGDRVHGSDFLANVLSGKAKFTDPEFVKAVDLIKQLSDNKAFNKDAVTLDDAQARDKFLQGDSAMFVSGSWSTTALLDGKPDGKNLAAAPFPSVEGGKGDATKTAGVGNISIAMNSNLKGAKKKAAEEFIKYFYSEDLYKDILATGTLVPADVDAPSDADPLLKDVINATKGGTAPVYDATLTADQTQTINNGLQSLITGDTTPEKLAKDMQAQVK